MSKKDPSTSLKESIAKLQAQQAEEKKLLKEELSYAFEHLKPSNVVRNTITDLITTVHAKKNLLTTVMGTGAGYLASAIFGPKPTLLNRVGARFIQNAVTLAVTQNSQAITDVALHLVTTLRRKIESRKGSSLAEEDLLQSGGEAI